MFDTVVSICPELFSKSVVPIPDAMKGSVISAKKIVAQEWKGVKDGINARRIASCRANSINSFGTDEAF
jgi:hypothetical protein